MKAVIRTLYWLITAGLLFGCGSNPLQDAMERADALMESEPEDAMAVLDSMDVSQLHSNKDKARFALLKSMALDKNWIDKTDFYILQPAIDYYLEKGTPDEKLKTYYYQGRIFQNQGDRDKAYGAFAKGLALYDDCKDSLMIARSLIAQGCIYHNFYDFNNYTEYCLKAADISKRISNKEYEFLSLLYGLQGATLLNDREKADSINSLLLRFSPIDNNTYRHFYTYQLAYIEKFGSESQIRNFLDSIPNKQSFSQEDLLSLIWAYLKIGENDRAEYMLQKIKDNEMPYDTLRYLGNKYKLLKNQGNFEGALEAYIEYCNMSSLNKLTLANNKRNAIEDKYRMEIESIKAANKKSLIIFWCLISILTLFLGLVIVLLVMHKIQEGKQIALARALSAEAKNDKLMRQYSALEEEQDRLIELLSDSKELPESIRDVVRHRIRMLNSALVSRITSVNILGLPFDEWEQSLKNDKVKFMNDNRIGFQIMYPRCIKYLEDHKLTVEEINYMCLYALGLNGTEIGKYLNMPSFKNKTKDIRRKLGLGVHDTNLGVFMRNLLQT